MRMTRLVWIYETKTAKLDNEVGYASVIPFAFWH